MTTFGKKYLPAVVERLEECLAICKKASAANAILKEARSKTDEKESILIALGAQFKGKKDELSEFIDELGELLVTEDRFEELSEKLMIYATDALDDFLPESAGDETSLRAMVSQILLCYPVTSKIKKSLGTVREAFCGKAETGKSLLADLIGQEDASIDEDDDAQANARDELTEHSRAVAVAGFATALERAVVGDAESKAIAQRYAEAVEQEEARAKAKAEAKAEAKRAKKRKAEEAAAAAETPAAKKSRTPEASLEEGELPDEESEAVATESASDE